MTSDTSKKKTPEKDIDNSIKGPGSSEPKDPPPPPATGPENVPDLRK